MIKSSKQAYHLHRELQAVRLQQNVAGWMDLWGQNERRMALSSFWRDLHPLTRKHT